MKKVFRDPVYNLIFFDKAEDLLLLKLIDTYEFQRLRRIRQLGVSWLTYPTAVHTRFSHSLGVAYLAGEIFDRLNLKDKIEFEDEDGLYELKRNELKLLLKTTALLHDIGHGPFSHAFEEVIGQKHEKWSKEIIMNENSSINRIIVEDDEILNKAVPLEIRKKFPKWIGDILDGLFPLRYINEIISSQMDADRFDYLLRDAYMCGVDYAKFDLEWILNNIKVAQIPHEDNRDGIVLNAEKGIYSIESFIVSRYHMYEQVYFHKTTRGAEKLIQLIFKRIKELIEGNEINRIGPIDNVIVSIFDEKLNMRNYLKLDDFLVITYINKWAFESNDDILKHLCRNFIARKLFKLVDTIDNAQLFTHQQYKNFEKFFKERNLEMKYYFIEDDYIDVPYKDDYLFGKKRSEDSGHIWLLDKNNKLIELAEASDIIKSLRNNLNIKYRGYCDRSVYEDFIKIVKGGVS